MAGCARENAPGTPERIAILRFENFSGDASVDWQGRALSHVLITELGAIPLSRLHAFYRTQGPRPISAPGISAEAPLALAAGATRIGYGEYTVRNNRLEARLTIEDQRTRTIVKVVEASAPAADVIGAATALAHQISPRPTPFPAHNPEALMFFVKATESPDMASVEQGLSQAIAADRDYAEPYENLAQLQFQRGDRAAAQAVVERALARKSLTDVERARFELQATEFGGDAAARQAALVKLARLDSSDPSIWRGLAQLAMNRHDYRQAAEACQKAVSIAPDDIEMLNLLGYAAAQTGQLQTGLAALRKYQTLRPKDANPLDSMADVHLLAGNLTEAGSLYLQAQKQDRAFLNDGELAKASMAGLLSGDGAAATRIAEQYFEARTAAKDPAVGLRRAEWLWLTGKHQQAAEQMEAAATSAAQSGWRDGASQAWAEASLYRLMLGDRHTAEQDAQKATNPATPASVGNALIARFLSLPPGSAAEWTARAAQQFPQPGLANVKNYALTYALLLSRDFAAAQTVLKQMWDSGTVAPDGLQVLLAWAYLENGKLEDAAALLKVNPLPLPQGFTVYTAFYMPRLFYLRGVLAGKQGRRDEASAQYRKFLDLSGPDALVWGEEAKARAAL